MTQVLALLAPELPHSETNVYDHGGVNQRGRARLLKLRMSGRSLPWRILIGLLACAVGSAGFAEPLPPPAAIGLLEIPQLFANPSSCGRTAHSPLHFFTEPDASQAAGEIVVRGAEPTTTDSCTPSEVMVRWYDEVVERPMTTEERDYAKPAAVVTEVRGPWYKILLAERTAWIKAGDEQHFYSLETLYQAQATYLSLAWDGRLCRQLRPYRQCPMTAIAPESAPPIEVLASRVVNDRRWFKIRFLAQGGCAEGDEPVPQSEGWVQAYGHENKPSIWFYSRGC